jgi:hypothetical protein
MNIIVDEKIAINYCAILKRKKNEPL